MKAPADFAQAVEDRPVLPPGEGERVSGYGVMGLPFVSGHVLGLRRWTASSVGGRFTSIWHRNPQGSWTFYESVACGFACTRYFSAEVDRVEVAPIRLDWKRPDCLRVCTADAAVNWELEISATMATGMMSVAGAIMPLAAWRSAWALRAMGAVAGRVLGLGKVQLSGETSNGQHFVANPLRLWRVTESRAMVEGTDLGIVGPLPEQTHMADFYFPQRGIFAMGRVFID